MVNHALRLRAPDRLSLSICRALCVPVMALLATHASAQEQFNTSFIHGQQTAEMADSLAVGDDILPGRYPFDIYLNQQQVDHREIEFKSRGHGQPGIYCLSTDDYRAYGVLIPQTAGSDGCYDLTRLIPGSAVVANAGIQRLDLQVPQTALAPNPQGAISPRLYSEGINAAFVNYTYSGDHTRFVNSTDTSQSDYNFVSLNNGINLGSWRFRNNSSFAQQSGHGSHWNNIASWAETDIIPWRSRLQIGQSNTGNAVFDSFTFRGVQLSSTPEMLPDSLRGYAPVVRGVASTNARVEVRQNGYTVYSTVVPPGPFALTDIYPSNLSGDLSVTVIEADGARHSFSVPYSSVPNMLREGIWEYQATAGRYHNGDNGYQPRFIQGTLSHGMKGDFTPYGGVLVAQNYRSGVVGVGKNLGEIGAISVDGSWSDTNLASGGSRQGTSLRLLYAKSLSNLGTEIQIAGYRYSTSGYFDFADAVGERASWDDGQYRTEYQDNDTSDQNGTPDWARHRRRYYESLRYNNKRQRVEATINQHIGLASVYLSVSRQNYWGSSGSDTTVQSGVSTQWRQVNYSLFYQNSRSNYGYSDNSLNLNVSVPFSIFSHDNDVTANFTATHSRQSGDGYNAGLSGTLLDDHRLNYFVQTGHTEHGGNTSLVNLGYLGSMGNVELGHSYNSRYQQTTFGASGGVVFHSGGVTLAQPLQNTFVLVKAKNAAGVRLENQPGVAIDRFGYAVLSSAMPYRHNRVALRTSDIGNGLDIPIAALDIVPTQRAIGMVTFDTKTGHSLLIHITTDQGDRALLGATIYDGNGQSVGVMGAHGKAYVSGVQSGQRLQMKWGDGPNDGCALQLPELPPIQANQPGGYQEITLTCRAQ